MNGHVKIILGMVAVGALAAGYSFTVPSASQPVKHVAFSFAATVPHGAFAIPPALKRTGEQDIVLRVSRMDAERVRAMMERRRLEPLRISVD